MLQKPIIQPTVQHATYDMCHMMHLLHVHVLCVVCALMCCIHKAKTTI